MTLLIDQLNSWIIRETRRMPDRVATFEETLKKMIGEMPKRPGMSPTEALLQSLFADLTAVMELALKVYMTDANQDQKLLDKLRLCLVRTRDEEGFRNAVLQSF